MKIKLFRLLISVCLSAALILVPTNAALADSNKPDSSVVVSAQGDAVIKNKNEVIYATLASDGSIHNVYAVNHFEVSKAGNVTDYGNYAPVINLTNSNPLTQKGDSISFHSEEGNFYYQGNMVIPDLPWTFGISYYLGACPRTA